MEKGGSFQSISYHYVYVYEEIFESYLLPAFDNLIRLTTVHTYIHIYIPTYTHMHITFWLIILWSEWSVILVNLIMTDHIMVDHIFILSILSIARPVSLYSQFLYHQWGHLSNTVYIPFCWFPLVIIHHRSLHTVTYHCPLLPIYSYLPASVAMIYLDCIYVALRCIILKQHKAAS